MAIGKYTGKGLILLSTLAFSSQVLSNDEFSYAGALALTHLTASEDSVKNETIGVLDLDLQGVAGQGRWHVYIEGTTTSKDGKVTSIYGESYADAGAAADKNGNGRIQISSAEYYLPIGQGELVVGLIFPYGFTESGRWANDETTQFVGSSFVNIATSGAPDYALGMGYVTPLNNEFTLSVLASQAQGLGDIDSEYSSLFEELDDYFFSAELAWQKNEWSINGSVWASTLETETLSGDGTDTNSGINVSLGYETRNGLLLARFGTANEQVSEASTFWGLSWQRSYRKWDLGVGWSQTQVSSKMDSDEVDDFSQFEFYGKYRYTDSLHLTASIQALSNSGFIAADQSEIEYSPTVGAFRLTYEF